MGLDMYANWTKPNNLAPESSNTILNFINDDEVKELFYWRKHPDLHEWMQILYKRKGGTEEFNCVPVRLTLEDIDVLEADIKQGLIPSKGGFFWGTSQPAYHNEDLKFIKSARKHLADGDVIFYTSWW